MTLNRIFLGFMALVGVAVGMVLVVSPDVRSFVLPPYLWILLAMLLFELAVFLRTRRAPAEAIAMEMRLLALVLAVVLMEVPPIIAGSPGRLF